MSSLSRAREDPPPVSGTSPTYSGSRGGGGGDGRGRGRGGGGGGGGRSYRGGGGPGPRGRGEGKIERQGQRGRGRVVDGGRRGPAGRILYRMHVLRERVLLPGIGVSIPAPRGGRDVVGGGGGTTTRGGGGAGDGPSAVGAGAGWGAGGGAVRREFDPYIAASVDRAKLAQDMENRPWQSLFPSSDRVGDGYDGRVFGLDLECVAVGMGRGHHHRHPGRVALVDERGDTLLDELVRHDVDSGEGVRVVSYLTPLTGLTKEQCESSTSKSLDEISDMVKDYLKAAGGGGPGGAILIGQSVHHDIEWLELKRGVDFFSHVNIEAIFRQRVPRNVRYAANVIRREVEGDTDGNGGGDREDDNNSASESGSAFGETDDSAVGFPTKYRLFSLRHTALTLLSVDIQGGTHDPSIDAKYAVLLFNKYRDATPQHLRAIRDSLHRAPITKGFAATNPVVEGVCMSHEGYGYKRAGRTIWRWYTKTKRGEPAF